MFKKPRLTGCLIRRRLTALRLKTFSLWFSFRFSAMSLSSNKSERFNFFIGVSLVVFVGRLPVHVTGLGENEKVIDDFDTGTANYWQGFKNNDSATFWQLRMHDEPRPPGINLLRPPSKDGDGFIEVFPVSDSPAQIFSNVFDLFPGATVEITYWNFVATYPSVRKTVLLLYKELIDRETGTRPPLQAVLIYSAPISNDPSLDWITVRIDLKITEPSKIQLRIDGFVVNSNSTGLAVSKIIIKNGLYATTTTSSSSTTGTSTSSTLTLTETSTVGSTMIHYTTELTSLPTTSSSLSSTSSSKSPTFIPTTIVSSTADVSSTTTISSSSISSSIPSAILSTTSSTSSSSIPSLSTSPTLSTTSNITSSTDSNDASTTPVPQPGMTTNQLRDVLIGVGVSILLFFLFCLLFILCYKRHRRRSYLIESRQLEAGIIRQLKQLEHNPSLPYNTVYHSPSISSTNSTQSPSMSFP